MVATDRMLTYDDLCQTPDDGKRYEIIEGELYVSAAPFVKHQRVVWNFVDLLRRAEQAGFGTGYVAPIDVIFDLHSTTEPDLLFIRRERRAIVTEKHVQGAPDLIIEILSEGTRAIDLGKKRSLYERFGVLHYWIVDTEGETVQPFELRAAQFVAQPLLQGGQTLTCSLFPGVSVAVADLFV